MNEINKNNELLENLYKILTSSRRDVNASLNVLSNNNKAIAFFLNTINNNHSKDELILRVYGLLQILFVSIDSLYTLSLGTTRTKNFISINDNKELRELKYIRNDVVGHPTNRIVDDRIEYSILKADDIYNDHLSYTIYFEEEETKREVNLVNLVEKYYIESNHFLNSLIDYKNVISTKDLNDNVYTTYQAFLRDESIKLHLKDIKETYLKTSSEGRILKKINLLINLEKSYYKAKNDDLYYIIAYHLKSLYNMICIAEGVIAKKITLPKQSNSIIEIKKVFMKKNYLCDLTNHLYDINHPLFYKSLSKLTIEFKNNEFIKAINYYASKKDRQMTYAYSSILRSLTKSR